MFHVLTRHQGAITERVRSSTLPDPELADSL